MRADSGCFGRGRSQEGSEEARRAASCPGGWVHGTHGCKNSSHCAPKCLHALLLFKPPSLWYFIMAALANLIHTHTLSLSPRLFREWKNLQSHHFNCRLHDLSQYFFSSFTGRRKTRIFLWYKNVAKNERLLKENLQIKVSSLSWMSEFPCT